MTAPPPRGFPLDEFEARLKKAQTWMRARELDAVWFSTEPEVRYFTGFLTQFWQSPTRPWFLVLPAEGKPIAVIPEIGAAGMAATWVEDIRAWPSPRPRDDGISLLSDTLRQLPARFGRIGTMLGAESHVRMPQMDFERLGQSLAVGDFADVSVEVFRQRFVKSSREIDKIAHICDIVSGGFEALEAGMRVGDSEQDICRRFRIDLLNRGADATPYVIGGSGPGGYDNIIMGPTDRVLEPGDVMIIDTGSVFDGHYCDFDRNWAFGRADDAVRRAHRAVWEATEAGFAAARPGATTSDIFQAMWTVMEAAGALGNDVGRLGHGLGTQLTEWPSNTADDETVLEPGCVLTLEPGMCFAPGRNMVHEENIVITGDGADWLTRRAPAELPVVG